MILKKKWEDLEKGDKVYQLSLETGNISSLEVKYVNKYWAENYNYKIVVKLENDIRFKFNTNRSWDEVVGKNSCIYAVNVEVLNKTTGYIQAFNRDIESLNRKSVDIILEKERLESSLKYKTTLSQMKSGDSLWFYNVLTNRLEQAYWIDSGHIHCKKPFKIDSIIDNYTILANDILFYTSESVAVVKRAINTLNDKFSIIQDSIDEIEKLRNY